MDPVVAKELETRFMAMNETPALKQLSRVPICQIGKGVRNEQTDEVVEKNAIERVRRGGERFHLERMSSLFKVARFEKGWSRVEVLIFGKMISVVGGLE